jgi:hypothetical protein
MESARSALAATEFLSKFKDFPSTVDTKCVALEKVLACEETCKITNEKFRLVDFDPTSCARLFSMQRKIEAILGDLSIEKVIDASGWGPGVTLLNRGRNATPFNKFQSKIEATIPLIHVVRPIWKQMYPLWDAKFSCFEGNRITTVPKNNRTDRPIAVEPSLNLWFQKGVGCVIRSKLLHWNVDLRDQSANQKLAYEGSLSGDLATIDFSSASDTISYGLILSVLPFNWFSLLDILRSPRGLIDDSLIEYEKFSSMGNGFTFELESLIFYAAALAVCPEDHPLRSKINIYGDDLIVPSDIALEVLDFFGTIGFSPNMKKSHISGYYRESCGKHYWNGCDITPIYFRESLKTPETYYTLHNQIRLLAERWGFDVWSDIRFKPLCSSIVKWSRALRKQVYRVPKDFGDGGFISAFDESCPPRAKRYQRGYNIYVSIFKSIQRFSDGHEVLLTRLWRRSELLHYGNNEEVPRLGKFTRSRVFSPNWIECRPWQV